MNHHGDCLWDGVVGEDSATKQCLAPTRENRHRRCRRCCCHDGCDAQFSHVRRCHSLFLLIAFWWFRLQPKRSKFLREKVWHLWLNGFYDSPNGILFVLGTSFGKRLGCETRFWCLGGGLWCCECRIGTGHLGRHRRVVCQWPQCGGKCSFPRVIIEQF